MNIPQSKRNRVCEAQTRRFAYANQECFYLDNSLFAKIKRECRAEFEKKNPHLAAIRYIENYMAIPKIKHKKILPEEPQLKEDTIHLHCIQWFYAQHGNSGAILHHSPNENPRGSKAQMICYNTKMKRLGRLSGYPDIEIKHQGKCLLVELKSSIGKLSIVQKSLFQQFNKTGFDVKIVRSFEEFVEVVNQFINCF